MVILLYCTDDLIINYILKPIVLWSHYQVNEKGNIMPHNAFNAFQGPRLMSFYLLQRKSVINGQIISNTTVKNKMMHNMGYLQTR